MQHVNNQKSIARKLVPSLAGAILAVSLLGGCGGAAGLLRDWNRYVDYGYMVKPEATILGEWAVEGDGAVATRYVFTPEGAFRILAVQDGIEEIVVDGAFEHVAEADLVRCEDAIGDTRHFQVRFLDPDHLVLTHEDGCELLLARI